MSRSRFLILTALALSLFLALSAWAGDTRPTAGPWESWTDLTDTRWARVAQVTRAGEKPVGALDLQTLPSAVRPILECEPFPSPSPSPAVTSADSLAGSFLRLTPIPEASTLVLALLGTVGISLLRRRRS